MDQPVKVQLGEPAMRRAPAPVRGCDVCSALAKQWHMSMEKGPAYDPSHATDLAVEIHRHPHVRSRQ